MASGRSSKTRNLNNDPTFSVLGSSGLLFHRYSSLSFMHRKRWSAVSFTLRKTSKHFRSLRLPQLLNSAISWSVHVVLLLGKRFTQREDICRRHSEEPRHSQWNLTLLSTSCLPTTGNTHTAWILWQVNLLHNHYETYPFSVTRQPYLGLEILKIRRKNWRFQFAF